MKKWIHLITLLILVSSCKSIEKMVEQGKYDEAIAFAAKKLHGEKNKKTKYVKALETAYHKVMQKDLDRIAFLEASEHANKYDRIFDMYRKIERRQETIRPFLPLISKDGYTAHFKFVRVGEKLNEVARLAAAYHYDQGVAYLNAFDTHGEKIDARRAYRAFDKIDKYMASYEDSRDLQRQAKEYGITYVAVSVKADHYVYAGDVSTYVLRNFNIDRLSDFWTTYDIARNFNKKADFHVVINVENIDLGVERERVDHFHERAMVEVGRQKIIDENGQVVKDTLGNILTEPIMNEVYATVTEVKREKAGYMRSSIIIKDERNKATRRRIPVEVEELFSDLQCTFAGDKRALPDMRRKRLDNYLAPFPHDIEMVENMSYSLRDEAYKMIEREMRSLI